MSEPTNSRQEPTTIIHCGPTSVIVKWRQQERDLWYLLGDKPPRYPVPAIHLHPHWCIDGYLRLFETIG